MCRELPCVYGGKLAFCSLRWQRIFLCSVLPELGVSFMLCLWHFIVAVASLSFDGTSLTESSFAKTASYSGLKFTGAKPGASFDSKDFTTVTMFQCYFLECYVNMKNTYACVCRINGCNLEVDTCKFEGCKGHGASCIYVGANNGASASFTNSEFLNCFRFDECDTTNDYGYTNSRGLGTGYAHGCVGCFMNSLTTFSFCNFTSNKDGAVTVGSTAEVNLEGCQFDNNTGGDAWCTSSAKTTGYGGDLCIGKDASLTAVACIFVNDNSRTGRSLHCNGGTTNLTQCTFSSTDEKGSTICFLGAPTRFVISDCDFCGAGVHFSMAEISGEISVTVSGSLRFSGDRKSHSGVVFVGENKNVRYNVDPCPEVPGEVTSTSDDQQIDESSGSDDSESDPDHGDSNAGKGLGGGEIAAIVIVLLIVICVAVVLVLLFMWRKRNWKSSHSGGGDTDTVSATDDMTLEANVAQVNPDFGLWDTQAPSDGEQEEPSTD